MPTNDSPPNTLRVGVIHLGKLVAERHLARREAVSIGTSPRATLTVTAPGLPERLELFSIEGGVYHLRLVPGIAGRLTEGERAVDVAELARAGAPALVLSDAHRGKLVLGELTVLFQLAPAPAIPERPILPRDAKGTLLTNLDPLFSGVFAATAVAMTVLVVSARNTPYAEAAGMAVTSDGWRSIDSFLQSMPLPEAPKPEAPVRVASSPTSVPGRAVGRRGPRGAVVAPIGAVRAPSDFDRLLDPSVGPAHAPEEAFAQGGGVEVLSPGTRTRDEGPDRADIGELGGPQHGPVGLAPKDEAEAPGDVDPLRPVVRRGIGDPTDFGRELKAYLSAVKDCYERQLKRSPKLGGKLTIALEILPSGRVGDVSFDEDTLGSPDTNRCIRTRAERWTFTGPSAATTVAFPFLFTAR